MRHVALAITRLYPRAWRDRYRLELVDVLGNRRIGLPDLVDLLRGALDAWVHPQPVQRRTLVAGDGAAVTAVIAAMPPVASVAKYGLVNGTPDGQVTRRRFLRRMLGAGVGLMSLEFIGGTIAFLWPPPADGIGVEHKVGTLDQIAGLWRLWPDGMPYEFRPARAFLVNVPAARAMALGERPTATATSARDLLALWRKCPHLGCMIPAACEERGRFQCLCHQSTYNIMGEKLKLGPAPRGMDRFPVRIDEEGTVIIDTRTIIDGPPTRTVTFVDAHPFDEGCR
jgi:Rieske Fe-S protein